MEKKVPPAFFKVFFPQSSSQSMELPYTEASFPENVMVKYKHGNGWNLKLEKRDNSYFFTEGWVKFVADNSLELGDMLVFYYVPEGLFNVIILDRKSACDKNICAALDHDTCVNNQVIAPDHGACGNNQIIFNVCENNQGIAPYLNTGVSDDNQDIAPNLKDRECENNQGVGLYFNGSENNQSMGLDLNVSVNDQGMTDDLNVSMNEQCMTDDLNVSVNDQCMTTNFNNYENNHGLDLDLNACEHNQGVAFEFTWVNHTGVALDLNSSPYDEDQGTVELEQIEHHCEANHQDNCDIERDDMECDEENNIDDETDVDYVPELEEEEEEEKKEAPATQKRTRRKRLQDPYGLEIFKAELAVKPLNPYFVTGIGVNRKHELYIPMAMVKRADIEFPIMTSLVDQLGRKFELKRSIWKSGRTYYTGGWSRFCRDNNVAEKDRCIIEFVPAQAKDDEPQINVTIIRASELGRLNG